FCSKLTLAGRCDGSNFKTIWENAEILNVVRTVIPHSEDCDSCVFYHNCKGGCIAINSDAKEIKTANDQHICHFTRLHYSNVIGMRIEECQKGKN
ncbi:MAG: hypothetical protein KAR40_18020, partial [Candidatus Sabulitectum sp.]|nr:hypothetical protein [Candidatus Sabulitectum sp.]